jgi:type IV secretory pathway VirB2 component (pilin)
MRRMLQILSLALLGTAVKASHALAAGGAPWDTQMQTVWQSITGGPFAALVLGAGIIGLGMALMASEHGSLWRGMPAFVLGGALVAGSQTVIPSFFNFGGGLAIPM